MLFVIFKFADGLVKPYSVPHRLRCPPFIKLLSVIDPPDIPIVPTVSSTTLFVNSPFKILPILKFEPVEVFLKWLHEIVIPLIR